MTSTSCAEFRGGVGDALRIPNPDGSVTVVIFGGSYNVSITVGHEEAKLIRRKSQRRAHPTTDGEAK